MRTPRITETRKGYSKTYDIYGESPKALQWQNYRSAAKRYRQLLNELDLEGKSILDAGCGMGDLLPYIYAKADDFQYLGVDIVPEFIDVAKKRYQGHDFQVLNPFEDKLDRKFDIVLACGTLNANKDNWLENRKAKIQKLFELANEALAFNMAGGLEKIDSDSRVAYAYAGDILDYCSTLTSKIILKSHYHSKDFTVFLFK